MTVSEQPDDPAIRYLLGEMTEEERDAFEMRMLSDPDLSELVAAAEADLLDAYVRGELSDAERKRVREALLTTDAQRSRLESAVALRAKLDGATRRRHWWWTIPVAAALAVVALVTLLQRRREPAPARPAPVIARVTTAQPDEPRPPLPTSTIAPEPSAPVVVTLTLVSSMTRGEGVVPSIALPGDAATLRLTIGLEPGDDDYASYRAVVQTAGGTAVVDRNRLRSRNGALQIDLPAASLAAGEYEVLVDGVQPSGEREPLGAWPFAVAP